MIDKKQLREEMMRELKRHGDPGVEYDIKVVERGLSEEGLPMIDFVPMNDATTKLIERIRKKREE